MQHVTLYKLVMYSSYLKAHTKVFLQLAHAEFLLLAHWEVKNSIISLYVMVFLEQTMIPPQAPKTFKHTDGLSIPLTPVNMQICV